MRKALILVQDGQISDVQIAELEALVRRHYAAHVGSDKLLVLWNRIPAGQAFTKYEDSRSSIVTLESPDGFEQAKRVTMLTELEADWRGVTGQHPDEIMLSLVDETLFAELFQSSQQRLTLAGRLKLISQMLRAMLGARLGKQAIIVIPNL